VLFLGAACDRVQRRLAYDPGSLRVTPPPKTPLPESGFRVRWNSHTVPRAMRANSDADVRLELTNVSDQFWPVAVTANPETRDGSYAVRLAYQWVPDGTVPAAPPEPRFDLPFPLGAGDSTALLVNVKAPPQPGDYQLQFSLTQESIRWFPARLVIPVHVTGAAQAQ
jgi:hypothetical protein